MGQDLADRSIGRERAQLVLVASVVVAVALVPMVLAYLQLGYHADVRASGDVSDPTADATAALDRATHQTTADVPDEFRWGQRRDAVDRVRSRLAPRIQTIERARIDEGTARSLDYNQTTAQRLADENCLEGTGRQFGECVARGGVVVQERAGRTQVLAIAFDLSVTSERGRTNATVVTTTAGAA